MNNFYVVECQTSVKVFDDTALPIEVEDLLRRTIFAELPSSEFLSHLHWLALGAVDFL